jgi:tRNA-specific 2-thiouridylase
MNKNVQKIALLLSGGVDSSVALKLLKDQGHQVTAFYLKIWLEDELSFLGTCPWQEDLSYAQAVCEQVGVPLEILSLQEEYWNRVVASLLTDIKAGRTPNPDILCNSRIKFGAFYDLIGAEYDLIATGHYAKKIERDGVFYLAQTPDPIKDQTYFLSQLTQAQLARALFPLENLTKTEVRALAVRHNLATQARKDSQGICFLGKFKFTDFLKAHIGERVGDIVEHETGVKLGEHRGFWYHTLGQRQGLGLAGGPWYVVAKDPEKNVVFVSRSYYSSEKKRDMLEIDFCNWLVTPPVSGQDYEVKLRHGAHMNRGTVQSLGLGRWRIMLSEQDQGIAPGQYAVIYKNGICLGSGIISESAV